MQLKVGANALASWQIFWTKPSETTPCILHVRVYSLYELCSHGLYRLIGLCMWGGSIFPRTTCMSPDRPTRRLRWVLLSLCLFRHPSWWLGLPVHIQSCGSFDGPTLFFCCRHAKDSCHSPARHLRAHHLYWSWLDVLSRHTPIHFGLSVVSRQPCLLVLEAPKRRLPFEC
jgi:hypothetical protein